ncbi:MAG: UbiX family flavin prenyltransferase [Nitrospiraceae bacterium]|nr:UbiX family flavin prenyltransferase [Nitrospiraceae bacterium]
MKRFIIGISGASGQAIGIKLLRELLERNFELHLVVSRQSLPILEQETGIKYAGTLDRTGGQLRGDVRAGVLFYYDADDMRAPIASGSFRTDAMFIAPCSMKTLSAVANGYASSLLERAADVTIKEGGKLILCPREMPFSAIHLENMLKLARLGVAIAPPVAAFYPEPKTIDEMVAFFAGKLLDQAGIENDTFKRWKG